MPQRFPILRIEQQESAAARADQLSTDRAIAPPELVPLVDLRIAHAARAPLFVLPMLVHQLTEFVAPSRFERGLTSESEVLDVMQVVDHLRIVGLGTRLLILQQT